MSQTIEEIENQIAELQKKLEQLKNPKLTVARQFSGQYFEPYEGRLLRRMESDGVPIWEGFLDSKKEWVLLPAASMRNLENIYIRDCLTLEPQPESVAEESIVTEFNFEELIE